jgi:hypothetical protein
MVVVVVVVVTVAEVKVAVQGGASEDRRRRTICVVSTWRTGQKEFEALMKKQVPTCVVYV